MAKDDCHLDDPEDRIRVSRKQARMTRAGRREQPVAQLEQRVGIAIWRTAQRYRRRRRTAKPLRDNRQQARMTRAIRSEESTKEEHGPQQAKKSMANSRQRRAWPTAGIERAQQVSRPATSSRSSVVQQTQVHPKCKERHVEMTKPVSHPGGLLCTRTRFGTEVQQGAEGENQEH